jgi:RHS repeat-associated protein
LDGADGGYELRRELSSLDRVLGGAPPPHKDDNDVMVMHGTHADWERMKFTVHERDLQGTTAQGDDLDYMHARYHNPNIGRFLSLDLMRGNAHSPQSFNLFAYVENNPGNFIDPYGMWTLKWPPPKPEEPPGEGGGEGFDQAIWRFLWDLQRGQYIGVALPGSPADKWGRARAGGSSSLLGYLSPSDFVSGRATLTGLYAWADGFNPFGNPFATHGYYDPGFPGAGAARFVGGLTFDAELGLATSGLTFESAAGRGASNWVTRNVFRWGPPKGPWGWHFHLGPGESVMAHHLPYQIGTWRYHARAVVGRWLRGLL